MCRVARGGRRKSGSSGLLIRWLAVSQAGQRPLHGAAEGGHVPAIMVMLAAGADKDARDKVPYLRELRSELDCFEAESFPAWLMARFCWDFASVCQRPGGRWVEVGRKGRKGWLFERGIPMPSNM